MTRLFFGLVVLNVAVLGFVGGAGMAGWVLTAMKYTKVDLTGRAPAVGPMPVVAVAPRAGGAVAGQKQAPAPAPDVQPDVKVVATEMKFAPNTLTARVGQPIKVTLENKGVIEHDLSFLNLKAADRAGELKVVAKPGQTAVLELTPSAKGNFEYVCTIPGHKEAGMRGNLGVVE